jgi:hypothetical protein
MCPFGDGLQESFNDFQHKFGATLVQYFILGIAFFFTGQILGWFQLNAQGISEWWAGKAFISSVVFGIPTSMLFWYGWKFVTEYMQSAWSARFIASSAGLIVFPVLTWMFLNETMMTPKTLVCLVLALVILFIQLYY